MGERLKQNLLTKGGESQEGVGGHLPHWRDTVASRATRELLTREPDPWIAKAVIDPHPARFRNRPVIQAPHGEQHRFGVLQAVVTSGTERQVTGALDEETKGGNPVLPHLGRFSIGHGNRHIAKPGPLHQAVCSQKLVARQNSLGRDRVQWTQHLPGVLDDAVFRAQLLSPTPIAPRPQFTGFTRRGRLIDNLLTFQRERPHLITQALMRTTKGHPLTIVQEPQGDLHRPTDLPGNLDGIRTILHDSRLPLRRRHLRRVIVLKCNPFGTVPGRRLLRWNREVASLPGRSPWPNPEQGSRRGQTPQTTREWKGRLPMFS